MAWLIACWGFFGLHAWLLARPLGAGVSDLAPTVGAFALAFVAGLLVVPLPAGAGVREGVLVATLAGSIGAPAALTVSLVSRLVLLAVDLVMAALFGVGGAARAVRSRLGGLQRTRAQPFGPLSSMQGPCCGARVRPCEVVVKLIIQIPCLNEADHLPATLSTLPRAVPGFDVVEWLVIDDGSTDDTRQVALACGVDHVIGFPRNRGLAAAFSYGIEESLRRGADVIVNTDADNQYDSSCIPALVAPVLAGEADIVVGDRQTGRVAEFSVVKRALQTAGTSVVRSLSGLSVGDATSGFRAYSRRPRSRWSSPRPTRTRWSR